ncbi:hypothetical protein IW262DRAFT_1302907 [Armillaria fumosa]|nr:hypothetical protein IW262DRAFT_1302907 [Armillaria fumosa]
MHEGHLLEEVSMIQDRVETGGIGMNNESKEPLREWEDGIIDKISGDQPTDKLVKEFGGGRAYSIRLRGWFEETERSCVRQHTVRKVGDTATATLAGVIWHCVEENPVPEKPLSCGKRKATMTGTITAPQWSYAGGVIEVPEMKTTGDDTADESDGQIVSDRDLTGTVNDGTETGFRSTFVQNPPLGTFGRLPPFPLSSRQDYHHQNS